MANSRLRTNAETRMFYQLDQVAQLGQLYHELIYRDTYLRDIQYEFLLRGEDVPESVQKALENIRNLLNGSFYIVEEELINRIEKYNDAYNKVKNDTRPRREILAEDWKGREEKLKILLNEAQ